MEWWLNKPSSLCVSSYALLIILSFAANKVWASACCGGGFAAPALIAGDDKAIFTGSYLYSQISTDVYADGLWSKRDFQESHESFRLDGAHIFRDRWQGGFSLPVVRRERQGEVSTGVGDVAVTLGHEYLPDWDYSPWRPKGLGYLQLTAPTGRSVYEADSKFQLDARGRGFWALGMGTLLTKIKGRWDFFSNLDLHHSLGRNNLKPGWGGNIGLGAGFNWARVRTGASLVWTFEDPVQVTGVMSSPGSGERYATASINSSYLYSDDWAGTLTYSDQTLFGNPVNARLGHSVILQLQRRWSR